MKLARRLVGGLLRRLVALDPEKTVEILRRDHLDAVARGLNRDEVACGTRSPLPAAVDGFEDLAFLFWNTPLTRGILRQDLDEAAALFRAVRSLEAPRGVEIGRFQGGSTILLAAAVSDDGRLHSIDISPRDDAWLDGVLERLGLRRRVELIVGDANEVELEGPLDFVLIDGDHDYEAARRDHETWGPRVRPGGLIVHHDMAASRPHSTQWPSLARLREQILATQRHDVELLAEAGSLTILRRLGESWTSI